MPELRTGAVTARVPATSANLGAGYDAFGLALGLYDEVSCEVLPEGRLEIEVTGEAADEVPRDESHLIVRSVRAAFDAMGVAQPGLRLVCRNGIPHGRGLGSSAAAVVSGLTVAAGLVTGVDWSREDTLRLANEIEGHPDNVAACIYGGFTIAWGSGAAVGAARLDVLEGISVLAFVPTAPMSTHIARALLPDEVPHADAAFNAGRAALMVAALTQDPALLFEATEDRLHQTYRQAAMPTTLALVEQWRSTGIPAFVSGAGPSVLILSGPATWAIGWTDDEWTRLQLDIDPEGARIVDAAPEAPKE